jgi:cell division protein ZapA
MPDNGGSTAIHATGSTNVKIEIYDQAYNVNADQNEEHLQALAAYVDAKMREVASATRIVDSLKVAVLASLNIADELFMLRERQQEIDGPLRQRVEKCVALV